MGVQQSRLNEAFSPQVRGSNLLKRQSRAGVTICVSRWLSCWGREAWVQHASVNVEEIWVPVNVCGHFFCRDCEYVNTCLSLGQCVGKDMSMAVIPCKKKRS